jgi:amino acid transporter
MLVGAPLVLLSIASMLFFFVYLIVFIDLLLLRNKKPDTMRPFFAGGPFKFPAVAILGIIAIIFILIGNAIEDPAIISVGLPVVGICYLIPLLFYRLKRRKEHLE